MDCIIKYLFSYHLLAIYSWFESGYENFKIGVLLRQAREEAGMTQEQLAKKLNTKKSAISRIENHAEDIRLSTLHKYAEALGKTLQVRIA